MKQIKVKFIGFANDFDENNNIFINLLRKHYDVVLSDEPDYLFASLFGRPYEYCKYDCVRIFFSGENYSTDFNVFDYGIGFDPMTYTDRYIRYPIYYLDASAEKLDKEPVESLNNKYFCSFVFGHHSANGIREEVLHKLNEYKRVESAGRFENNMPDGYVCNTYEKKKNLLKESKFSIACESTDLRGFTTEKLLHALECNTVPIYFGNEDVANDFNKNRYIKLNDFNNVDEMIEYVKKVDNDDELYQSYLKGNKYARENQYEEDTAKLEKFLVNIFNQDLEKAYRRPRYYYPINHTKKLILINYIWKYNPDKLFHTLYKFVKKVKK